MRKGTLGKVAVTGLALALTASMATVVTGCGSTQTNTNTTQQAKTYTLSDIQKANSEEALWANHSSVSYSYFYGEQDQAAVAVVDGSNANATANSNANTNTNSNGNANENGTPAAVATTTRVADLTQYFDKDGNSIWMTDATSMPDVTYATLADGKDYVYNSATDTMLYAINLDSDQFSRKANVWLASAQEKFVDFAENSDGGLVTVYTDVSDDTYAQQLALTYGQTGAAENIEVSYELDSKTLEVKNITMSATVAAGDAESVQNVVNEATANANSEVKSAANEATGNTNANVAAAGKTTIFLSMTATYDGEAPAALAKMLSKSAAASKDIQTTTNTNANANANASQETSGNAYKVSIVSNAGTSNEKTTDYQFSKQMGYMIAASDQVKIYSDKDMTQELGTLTFSEGADTTYYVKNLGTTATQATNTNTNANANATNANTAK